MLLSEQGNRRRSHRQPTFAETLGVLLMVGVIWGVAAPVSAGLFGGIEFPQGAGSFADAVIRFDPRHSGGPVADPGIPGINNPHSALGPPDYDSSRFDDGYTTLGRGGLLELRFVDNRLTNSGDSRNDLFVFEIGPDVEDTYVAIRPTTDTLALLDPALDHDGDGFFEVGKVFGSTSWIDVDAWFPGFAQGALIFDSVQLIDDPLEGEQNGPYVGADIDAVGAISSVRANSIPEPSSILLLLVGAACANALTPLNRRRL